MTKDKINDMIQEIEKNGNLSNNDMCVVKHAMHDYLKRCHDKYPYYDFFTLETGKEYGDAIESKIISGFEGFSKPENDTSFDAMTESGEKIEIKSLRACSKGRNQIFLKEDQVSPSKFSTSSYQQTKPDCCDWFVYHILYGNGSRIFVVPSKMISKHPGKMNAEEGKIPLSVQHRDHKTEGQVNLGQVIKYAKYFEIKDYKLEAKYKFTDFQEEIKSRLDDINWYLPR